MIFNKLRQIREFERKHFGFIRSQEDRDLLIAIGYAQESGRPISFKQLTLEKIAAPSTLQRRLNRLIALGIVIRGDHVADRRSSIYTISSDGLKVFARYERTFLSDRNLLGKT